jgi:thiamine biosynthesis protein ThiC
VYFLPALVEVAPAFAHLVPALTAALAGEMGSAMRRSIESKSAKDLFMI